MTFRPPREEDYLGSYLRRHVFQHLLQRELTFDTILDRSDKDYDPEAKMLLTDDDNPLSKWQDEDASHHWQCEFFDSMRITLSASTFQMMSYARVPLSAPLLFFPLFLI